MKYSKEWLLASPNLLIHPKMSFAISPSFELKRTDPRQIQIKYNNGWSADPHAKRSLWARFLTVLGNGNEAGNRPSTSKILHLVRNTTWPTRGKCGILRTQSAWCYQHHTDCLAPTMTTEACYMAIKHSSNKSCVPCDTLLRQYKPYTIGVHNGLILAI